MMASANIATIAQQDTSKIPQAMMMEVANDSAYKAESFDLTVLSHGTATIQLLDEASRGYMEASKTAMCMDILDILEKYGKHIGTDTWSGKTKFLTHVSHRVENGEPIQLTLPAFPCKSSNRRDKVLGHVPDMGEELALRRLNDLANSIQQVYVPGATINIVTDGVLFNDILEIPDEDVWDYGTELMAMVHEHGLHNIRFIWPQQLLGLLDESAINKSSYLATTNTCREVIEKRFGRSDEALTKLLKEDNDSKLTYCGMVKFLESERASSAATLASTSRNTRQKIYKALARRMMQRSEMFTAAIRELRPFDVRLSMHPSSGAAKLSFPLIPSKKGDFQRSPWHSCVVMGTDGHFTCIHSSDVPKSFELVHHNGRPYFYREQ